MRFSPGKAGGGGMGEGGLEEGVGVQNRKKYLAYLVGKISIDNILCNIPTVNYKPTGKNDKPPPTKKQI